MDFFDPQTPAGRLRRRIAIGSALALVSAATIGSAAAGLWAHAHTPPGPVPAGPIDLHWPPQRRESFGGYTPQETRHSRAIAEAQADRVRRGSFVFTRGINADSPRP